MLSVSLTVDSHLSVAVFLQQELDVRAGGRDVLRSGSDSRSQPVSLVKQEGKAAHGRPGSGGTSQYRPTPTTQTTAAPEDCKYGVVCQSLVTKNPKEGDEMRHTVKKDSLAVSSPDTGSDSRRGRILRTGTKKL